MSGDDGPYAAQRVALRAPAVTFDAEGARHLGVAYWREVARLSRGLVRPKATAEGIELTFLRLLPLLRFGPAEVAASDSAVQCRFGIRGGLLASGPGGFLLLDQRREPELELLLAVEDFRPRLASAGPLARVRRRVFQALQVPLHEGVGRRYLARAARGAL